MKAIKIKMVSFFLFLHILFLYCFCWNIYRKCRRFVPYNFGGQSFPTRVARRPHETTKKSAKTFAYIFMAFGFLFAKSKQ